MFMGASAWQVGQDILGGGVSLLVALRLSSKQVSHIEGIRWRVRWMGGAGTDGRDMGTCCGLDWDGGLRVVE